ncbi:hypothetical protein BKA80DRAFT_318979 [Phyllosticta citrichinensis]
MTPSLGLLIWPQQVRTEMLPQLGPETSSQQYERVVSEKASKRDATNLVSADSNEDANVSTSILAPHCPALRHPTQSIERTAIHRWRVQEDNVEMEWWPNKNFREENTAGSKGLIEAVHFRCTREYSRDREEQAKEREGEIILFVCLFLEFEDILADAVLELKVLTI